MTDTDTRKLEDLLKNTVRPIKELVEVLKNKVDHQDFYLASTASNVKSIREQQSVANEKLDALWDQVVRVTENIDDVKETLDNHTKVLKRIEVKTENNFEDVKKIDKRLTTVEGHQGIVPPPELTIA